MTWSETVKELGSIASSLRHEEGKGTEWEKFSKFEISP